MAALRELLRPYAAGTLVEASRRISPYLPGSLARASSSVRGRYARRGLKAHLTLSPWQPCASFLVRTRPVRSSRPQGASHPISLAALRELPRPYAAGTLVEASRCSSPLREHPFWGSPSARDRKVDGSIPDSYNPPSSRYESAPLVFGRFAFGEMALASKGNGSKHRTRGRPGRVPRSFGWTRPEVDMALAKDLVNRERSGAVAALARASSSVRGRHGR